MKILVVSDTHGRNEDMLTIIKKEQPDLTIHCGDLETDVDILSQQIDGAFLAVAGNMDYDPDMDRIKEFSIGKYKAILNHGNRYKVNMSLDGLYYLAVENHANFVFFGHTHVPMIRREGPVTFINPGSLTYPRQLGRECTYIIMNINDKDEPNIELKTWS